MRSWRRDFGDRGEDLAAEFLRAEGFRVLERRRQVGRFGEIDLVCLDGRGIVFVEVKTRRDAAFGPPEEAVTRAKLEKLGRSIERYRLERGLDRLPYRLDVVAVDLTSGRPVFRHHRDVGM
jgi:putative endonuclease